MAHSNSHWSLVASEPDDGSVHDQRAQEAAPTPKSGFRRQLHLLGQWRARHSLVGWKFGVQLGLILTIVILSINIVTTAIVIGYYGVDSMGKASITTGPCDTVKRYNTVYHLFINIMSTLLIGASNYTMQMLSAPIRSEVDRAHSKGLWLDIGVPSWRNLKQINKARVTLWIILSLSSVPLHLFFNSAVFVTLFQHSYHVVEIAPSFFQAGSLNVYDSTDLQKPIASSPYSISDLHQYATNNSLVRRDNGKCIEEVLVPMNTQNVLYLLVNTGDPNKPYAPSDLQYRRFVDTLHSITYTAGCDEEPGKWACNQLDQGPCDLCWPQKSELVNNASRWEPDGNQIDYCLNLRAQEQCALEFSIPIMFIIIVMNIVKVIMFAFIAYVFSESPIVTLGDAIATFINRPVSADPYVIDPNMAISADLPKPRRRWAATSKRRWLFSFLSLFTAEAMVIFWLIYAAIATERGSSLFDIPFATVDPRAIIYTWQVPSVGVSAVIANALIANIAQPVLSAIYFAFNGLITAMCSANEWNSYSLDMKGLRVSGVPVGAQRSTHFLQLPYRYGAPLMVLSILTHWMVSQAIFVVSVLNDGDLNLGGIAMTDPYYVTCGYSPPAIIGVIALGVCILLYTIFVGSMKLKSRAMPVAGSNSMSIGKQCVIEETRHGLEKMPLQWGIRRSARLGHGWVAGFSDLPVNGGEKEMEPMQRRKGYISVGTG